MSLGYLRTSNAVLVVGSDTDSRRSASEPLPPKHTANSKPARFPSTQLAPLDMSMAKCTLRSDLPTPDEIHTSRSAQLPPPHKLLLSPAPQNASILFGPKFPTPDSSADEDAGGFTPYYMDRVEPKARELQRSSRFSLIRRQRTQPSEPMVSAGLPSPGSSSVSRSSSESQQNFDEQASPAMRLKRSLSSLIRRSSSMMRRNKSPILQSTPETDANNGSIRQTRSEDSNRSCVFVSRNSSMSSDSTCGGLSTEEVSCALSLSHFYVSSANTMVSPLVGKSMVLVKVVMDANTAVVVSVMRSMVFARARERMLTKLFQGGVPFVETKRRKLVLRRPEDGGIVAVVGDNPTWRSIMDSVGHPYQWLREGSTAVNSPRSAEPYTDGVVVGQRVCAKSEIRTVPKLTLHLVDPGDVADMCSSTL